MLSHFQHTWNAVLEASSTSAARGVSLSLLKKNRQTNHTLSPIHQPPGPVVVATANLHPGYHGPTGRDMMVACFLLGKIYQKKLSSEQITVVW